MRKGPTEVKKKGKLRSLAKDQVRPAVFVTLKVLKWILILVIPLNIIILLGSFAFPGRLAWIDNYQVAVQKRVVYLLDKPRRDRLLQRKRPGDHQSSTIQYEELRPFLESIPPGTLFFSAQGRRVSNMFIKSEWKHCGIFLGTLSRIEAYWGKNHELVRFLRPFYNSEDEYLVFDSSYDRGVSVHSIREMAEMDRRSTLQKLLLIECNLGKEDWSQALIENSAHLGKPYDYCFVLHNDDAFYCSEFLYALLPVKHQYFQPSEKIAGRPLLLPADLVEGILDKGVKSGTFSYTACISKEAGALFIEPIQ